MAHPPLSDKHIITLLTALEVFGTDLWDDIQLFKVVGSSEGGDYDDWCLMKDLVKAGGVSYLEEEDEFYLSERQASAVKLRYPSPEDT